MAKKKKKVRPHYVAKANRKKEPMSKKEKIYWFAGSGLVLLAIVLFFVLYSDGSLTVRNGAIAEKQDNWIISKLETARSSKYFKLGEVLSAVDGYAEDPETSATLKTDANEKGFYYNPVDPDSQVDNYYITGVASKAEDMVQSLPLQFALYFPGSEFSEPQTMEIAGVQAHYLIALMPEPEKEEAPEEAESEPAIAEQQPEDAEGEPEVAEQPEDAEVEPEESKQEDTQQSEPEEAAPEEPDEAEDDRTATQQFLCYIPSVRNSCILVSINLKVNDEMPEWTEEALLAMAQSIGETIVVGK